MQQEIRFATFNVCNLAPAGAKLYDNLAPLTAAEYEAKIDWTAHQLDQLDADVVGLQEVFSLDALRDVLARSRRYGGASVAGVAPDPHAERLTPQVALISRLPLAAPAASHPTFPAGVAMPIHCRDAERYARAPVHARLLLPGGTELDVLVVHLKSKRPDYRSGDANGNGGNGGNSGNGGNNGNGGHGNGGPDSMQYAQANLRSLIRRGTEAVALRALAGELALNARRPCVVLGDFNDTLDAVTTSIVLGAGAPCSPDDELRGRLFDSNQIQLRQDQARHLGYTNVHEGRFMTIDHVLVSEHFNPASRHAIGEVLEVNYLNDHLLLQRPETSDHGQVLVRLRLNGVATPVPPLR
ncbi:endonuclease/exonuclease/phosphatase family protein [Rugamonas apoptosis]|uniref:Endonuclease/exonuclease/phosphatase family protein n=1 Tax=Rugamonas apoptosis TaxID=2758570 RepID=A0A7W2IL39_9BURK|nr:endonuclease/exonuclease/phosphatase family protein [Rugamonas apoptosis]MBA5688036.1 endonuclease/exonuclease/phosphatase family protein [Rugamonas apoptosis]